MGEKGCDFIAEGEKSEVVKNIIKEHIQTMHKDDLDKMIIEKPEFTAELETLMDEMIQDS